MAVRNQYAISLFAVLILACSVTELCAQDSAKTLKRVTLSARKAAWAGKKIFPSLTIRGEDLRRVNSTSIADVARLFPGTLVKDYGGVGGLKTISVRSLGGQHNAVMYDGIAISDMQGGQVDLGKISTGNLYSITLSHAQPSDLLQPARAFASASALMIQSRSGLENGGMKQELSASIRSGSFGFVNPVVSAGQRLSASFYHRISAEYQRTDGNYRYKSYDNSSQIASRINSDAANVRIEYDAAVKTSDSSLLRFKACQYYSDRGLPGSVILFNQNSRQRLTDRDLFLQASWKHTGSGIWQTLVNAKYSRGYKRYVDPDFLNSRGYLENRFREQEWYGSAAVTWKPNEIMTWSLASDYFHTRLRRSGEFIGDSSNPSRNSWLTNLGLLLQFNRLNIQPGLLATLISDRIAGSLPAKDIHRVTPTVAVQYQPFDSLGLRLRFYYKEIFRAPTFNDLYYTFVGNVNLRPETVKQFNAGLSFEGINSGIIPGYQVSVDVYANRVKDKIMAVPRMNLFQWSMMNIGKADIRGIDLSILARWRKFAGIGISTRMAYGYQQTKDITDPNGLSYKNPLPYAPEHSGSASVVADWKAFYLSYHIVFSSYRYRPGDPVPDNLVQGWATNDIKAGWSKKDRKGRQHECFFELNNLFNTQYEIIRYYPMPGFQFRAGYIFSMHKI